MFCKSVIERCKEIMLVSDAGDDIGDGSGGGTCVESPMFRKRCGKKICEMKKNLMAWTGNTVEHLRAANIVHEKRDVESLREKNQCIHCKSLILPPPSAEHFFWRCFACDHWLHPIRGSEIQNVSELKVSQAGNIHIIDYDVLAYKAISMQMWEPGVLCSSYTVCAAKVKVKSGFHWVDIK